MVKIFKERKVEIEFINQSLGIFLFKKREDVIEKALIVITKIKNNH